MYDPSTGRWLTEDPIAFDAEDINLYRYVKNEPSITTDPTGLLALFFDGNQMKPSDNTIITQMHAGYPGTKNPVYRFRRIGMFGPIELLAPGLETARTELSRIVKEAVTAAKAANARGEEIDLYGYSRGAVAALLVAFFLSLEKPPIPVRFVGLIDPSPTWSGLDTVTALSRQYPLTSNVKYSYVAIGKAWSKNRFDQGVEVFVQSFVPAVNDPKKTQLDSFAYKDKGHMDLGKDPRVGYYLWTMGLVAGVRWPKQPFPTPD